MLNNSIQSELKRHSSKERARSLSRFFKTGKGEYGEGDKFLGIRTPNLKKVVQKYYGRMSLRDVQSFLSSEIHEHRSFALEVLKKKYKKAKSKAEKEKILKFYLRNLRNVNNWDLVDTSAHYILGEWLIEHPQDKKVLYGLAKSNNLWEKRIAIISTFAFIHQNQFDDTLKISMILLADKHDLIHKAVGWMLREVGKRDQAIEEKFLKSYSKIMPRTMLRYAIERFPEKKRKFYMKK